MTVCKFNQVPQGAVQVPEHGNRAVVKGFGLALKFNAFHKHMIIVAPEIIRPKEQEYTPACLVSNIGFLLRSGGFGEKQRCSAILAPSGRRNHDPALVLFGLPGIIHQFEIQLAAIKRDGFVIVAHDEADMGNGLVQGMMSIQVA